MFCFTVKLYMYTRKREAVAVAQWAAVKQARRPSHRRRAQQCRIYYAVCTLNRVYSRGMISS
jgi:hypothetical protein